MRKSFFLLAIAGLLSLAVSLNAQTKKEKLTETVFSYVDSVPDFVGGREAMAEFLTSNMEFPEKATKKKVKKGKVYVQFVVKADGEIVNCKIEKTSNKIFDKEAIRLVEAMPTWKPAILNGNNVHARYTLPIKFGYSSVLDAK